MWMQSTKCVMGKHYLPRGVFLYKYMFWIKKDVIVVEEIKFCLSRVAIGEGVT